jgi:hypothetical protein
MSVLFIHSHFGPPSAGYAVDERVTVIRETELTEGHIAVARGIITTTHLDQIGWLKHMPAVSRLLERGGNWVFNGHVLRRFLPGLDVYRPLEKPKRADFAMVRLIEHPIFAGIDQKSLEENKGVAGFYGRGHNPLPAGGVAVNGIGPDRLPIDWAWERPEGGRMFSHAGNDLGGPGGDSGRAALLTSRVIAWANGEI